MVLDTAKWALPYPQETDPDDPPTHIQQLAAALDLVITGWAADTWANRPVGAAIKDGLWFWAVDQGTIYVGQGGTLHSLAAPLGTTADVTTAAFGDAPNMGASGRYADAVHRHGQPANPITGHLAASDPHAQYAFDTDVTAATASIIAALATGKEPVWPGAVATRFFGGTAGGIGTTHPYTVPAGKVAIFRRAEFMPSGTVTGLTLYLADGAGTGWGGVALVNQPLYTGEGISLSGFYVCPAGCMVTLASAAADGNAAYVSIEGTLLNVPASGPAPILLCNQYTAAGDNTLYTVPAGKTLVILTALVTEIGGVNTTCALRIQGVPVMIPWFGAIRAGSALQADGMWVANAGDTIQANVGGDAGSHCVFSLSGVLI